MERRDPALAVNDENANLRRFLQERGEISVLSLSQPSNKAAPGR